nr:hypothetical protein [uncultured Methanolobus sp.]
MTSTAMALSYSPNPPSPGDTVTITGIASSDDISNGQLPVSVVFEKTESVSNGEYSFDLETIIIPENTESLSLKAEGVDSLHITVTKFGIPISVPDKYVTVTDNIASFGTGIIKAGPYKISLTGTSSGDAVTLKFGGKGFIDDVSAGESFEYQYELPEDMPEEMFVSENVLKVTVGGETLSIPLGTTADDSSSSSSSSGSSSSKKSSSHTGTELKIVDADTLGDDEEESSGVGDDVEKILHNADSMASTQDSSETSESETGSDDVNGYILENKTSSNEESKLPELGLMGGVIGVLCLGAIFLGFRKNRYR